ncbi:MAG: tetratricopeptide repeat protein [Gammaproteobacteria bacterium]
MTPAQWEEIRAHFDAAVELDEMERADYLLKRCSDPLMRRQVSLMLMADEEDSDDLSLIVKGAANQSFTPTIAPGTRLGAFEIIDDIDHGGMGSVYLAKRADEEFEQFVAIKVVNVALAGGQALSRFKSERQILARLEHPNIARLIDGGTTEAGAPYLVMEYVKGVAIDDYCDNKMLTTTQRLDLFMQVCSAIHVAHQNLIVHRDIKPANILVTDDGEPKPLDFGIAKLPEPQSSGNTLAVTQANMRLFTPLFASPEQVQGKTITTASDIYSLGVLLYILLLGTSPYRVTGDEQESLLAAICTANPERPSTRVTTVAAEIGDGVFDVRGTTASNLRKRLRGDLDNIVLMALRKEPERRYESARALAKDIENYLRDRPVSARHDTLGYRLGKYVRRNAAAVTVATAATIGLVTLATFYTLQLAQERDRAQRAAVEATQTAEFLQNLFRVTDPNENSGEEITARMLLDQGARQLDATLKDQPRVRAALQSTIGNVYASLGMNSEARSMLEQSLAALENQSGPTYAEQIDVLNALSHVLLGEEDFDQAEALAERAIALTQNLPDNDVKRFESQLTKTDVALALAEYDGLEKVLLPMLEELEAQGLQNDLIYAQTLTTLAQAYEFSSDFARADATMRRAIALYEKTLGSAHSDTIFARRMLAFMLDRQQKYAEAEPLLLNALASSQRLFGDVHRDVAMAQGELGTLYRHWGKTEKAMSFLEASLQSSRLLHGSNHSDVGYDLVAVANIGYSLRGMSFSEPRFKEALEIYSRTLPEDHPVVAAALIAYAHRLEQEKRPDEARPLIERGQAICAASLPPEHWLTAQFDILSGRILVLEGDNAAATPLLKSGFDRLVAGRGIAHGASQSALRALLTNLEAVDDMQTHARYAPLLEDSD